MARSNSSGLELTFHKPTSRWCKVIDGKRRYFGSGNGKSDRASYRQALEKYRQLIDSREQARGLMQVQVLLDENLKGYPALREFLRPGGLLDLDQVMKESDEYKEVLKKLMRRFHLNPDDNQINLENIQTAIQAYMQEQQKRFEITKKEPDVLPRKKRLSFVGLKGIRDSIDPFRQWVGTKCKYKTFGDEKQTEQILKQYRAYLEDEMLAGRLSAQTVSNRATRLRPLIKWLWTQRIIDQLPRNLDTVCQQYGQEKKAKSLDLKTIRKIWQVADARMKALISLALNCGLYAAEIASIKVGDIHGDYLAKRRHKTGVPYKIKLWPTTKLLIEQEKDGQQQEDLLFLTRNDRPLVHENGKSKTDAVSQAFTKLMKKHNIKAVWSQFRDTTATEIEKIGKQNGNPTVVSQLLAHVDGRTARFYIDQSIEPKDLDTSRLDAAIDELEKIYNLTL